MFTNIECLQGTVLGPGGTNDEPKLTWRRPGKEYHGGHSRQRKRVKACFLQTFQGPANQLMLEHRIPEVDGWQARARSQYAMLTNLGLSLGQGDTQKLWRELTQSDLYFTAIFLKQYGS